MIGMELEIEILPECVAIAINPDGDDLRIDLSREAFDALVKHLDQANERGEGYYSRCCFDVDEDEE